MRVLVSLWFILICLPASAEPLLVDKQHFTLESFTTFSGQTIKNVQVGWESYGKLNDDKNNVILVTHYFSGNSHAAGKYHPDDEEPGYWDAIIGPGKAIDTNKYYVLSVDTLVNLNVHHPKVITTGPATINPDTGKPYGLDFPVVTIRDFVNVQKALLDSLGIAKLHAVIGPSMGSLQALDWATAYPERVERMISVIGMGETDAWSMNRLEHWANPIRLDPNWNNGDYYAKVPPKEGLHDALTLITQDALHPQFINAMLPQHFPIEESPLAHINNKHSSVKAFEALSAKRVNTADANHLLYLVKASQLFVAGFDKPLEQAMQTVQAKALFLPAANDLILPPYLANEAHQALLNAGKSSDYEELSGDMGHLNGIRYVQQAGERIASFLAEPVNH
ncbi:Homoserine O-acetyltransferase [Saliniradius amylolyticus]|uniref:Probable acyltransferase n=1 Tax=Saliniradius amylolyticus TaxID=2183582 RepID=A0A2S2E2A9_9ALTE|nr:homoserine O-acetyltransferase [Saliniradius amylolyticus]AWL11781.1 Homoserine O-acetyltransferase [Saliniradius amylolyticus]